jgi:hypothetical protein
MRLLPLMLLVVCCPVKAGWESFTVTTDGIPAVHYIDPETLLKNGDFRQIWTLVDFIEPDKDSVLSKRMYAEFDCKRRLWRGISVSGHSKNNAEGNILFNHTFKDDPWSPIPPSTPLMGVFRRVCSK